MLWCCWFGDRKGIWPVKTEWWGAGVVICLWGAALHMSQLMPLPLTVSCFSNIQIVLPFWYWLTRVVPDNAHTHTHPFNGPLSRTIRVSRYQKVKPIWILLKQETVSGSGISWAICKSAPRSRQTTTSAPHHSVFYRPDALPATQPTALKHWRLLSTIYLTCLQSLCWFDVRNGICFVGDLTDLFVPSAYWSEPDNGC